MKAFSITQAVLLTASVLGSLPVHAATFIVNGAADAVDAHPGDGQCASVGGVCTLRAAIQETNALAGADLIRLPRGWYRLTLAGPDEDFAATGDLDVTDDLTLAGT
jgi:CSLREA domain-containing protein